MRTPDPESGWLSEDDLAFVRRRVPMLYVEAIPVRLDGSGRLQAVGLLLRANEAGVMTRAFVSGRVRYGESVRDALIRHLENDLGATAFPSIPPCLTPFTIAEYSPAPWSELTDERQHAVALVYLIPVTGSCDPRQDALEVSWLAPDEALDPDVLEELEGGRERVMRAAIAHLGRWP